MQSLVEYFVYLLLALLIQIIPHSLAISSAGSNPGDTTLEQSKPFKTPTLLCNQQPNPGSIDDPEAAYVPARTSTS